MIRRGDEGTMVRVFNFNEQFEQETDLNFFHNLCLISRILTVLM